MDMTVWRETREANQNVLYFSANEPNIEFSKSFDRVQLERRGATSNFQKHITIIDSTIRT